MEVLFLFIRFLWCSKIERWFCIVGLLKKLGLVSVDDDDVFGKDDKGYEGMFLFII